MKRATSVEPTDQPGPDDERPVVDGDQRLADSRQSDTVGSRAGQIVLESDNRKQAGDTRHDDGRLEGAEAHVAHGERPVVPLDDGVQRDGCPDDGRSENHLE